jgi:hypothetical protein
MTGAVSAQTASPLKRWSKESERSTGSRRSPKVLDGFANADGSISSVSKTETGISRLAKRIPELLGICDPSFETDSREGAARGRP